MTGLPSSTTSLLISIANRKTPKFCSPWRSARWKNPPPTAPASPIPSVISRHYCELVPDALEPQHRLLDLLRETHQWDQVIELARQVIAAHPGDGPALAALAMGLELTGKPNDALDVAKDTTN